MNGMKIIFDELQLQNAMQSFLTVKHTMDESINRKRKCGYIIFAKKNDFKNTPFLKYNFKRWVDAKFVINLLNIKIPETINLGMYIKKIWTDKEEKNYIRMTKFEVLYLDNRARKIIWENFKV